MGGWDWEGGEGERGFHWMWPGLGLGFEARGGGEGSCCLDSKAAIRSRRDLGRGGEVFVLSDDIVWRLYGGYGWIGGYVVVWRIFMNGYM